MTNFWQWKGDENTGSGLVHYTGSETVNISGNVTVDATGSLTVAFTGSETVAITGTSTVTFSGSETVNVSGNITIDITGSITVNLSGNATVNVSGNVTSNISGNVTIENILKGTSTLIHIITLTASLTGDATYTSEETSIVGFNSILLETTLETAGNTAKTDIAGAFSSSGTMIEIFDKDSSAQMTTGLLTSSRTLRFIGLPDYLGFTTTLSAGMTAGISVTVMILPLNL